MGGNGSIGWGGAVENCDVTLRGLRVVALDNEIVPWLRVELFEHQGGMNALLLDENGEWLRASGKRLHHPVPLSRQRVIRRAVRRARRLALADGEFSIVEQTMGNGWRTMRWLVTLIFAAAAGALVWFAVDILRKTAASSQGLPANLQVASFAVAGLWLLSMALMLAACAWMISGQVWANVVELAVDEAGVRAKMTNGSTVSAAWDEIVGKRRSNGSYRLRLASGRKLRVFAKRTRFVLDDQVGRGSARATPSMRRTVVRCFVLFQLGGLLAAWIVWQGWIQTPWRPWAQYLVVGWGIPMQGLVAVGAIWGLRWVAERRAARTRAVERSRRAGRVA